MPQVRLFEYEGPRKWKDAGLVNNADLLKAFQDLAEVIGKRIQLGSSNYVSTIELKQSGKDVWVEIEDRFGMSGQMAIARTDAILARTGLLDNFSLSENDNRDIMEPLAIIGREVARHPFSLVKLRYEN
jgi:hypothetical protein